VKISVINDVPQTQIHFETLIKLGLEARLRALESRSLRKGCESLDPSRNKLIGIGMEIDPSSGRVTKDSYGVFNLSWQGALHPEWAEQVRLELETIRGAIQSVHRSRLRFLLWAGMGGSAEDKSAYNALGLLSHGPRCYVLDSTDPGKLKHILEDMQRRSKLSLADVLRGTLVVGMALGMTSYEPVVNLRQIAKLYDSAGLDSRPNFIYMTLPGSLLDQFAGDRGYRRIELQLDKRNTVAGRTSSPLTRGSLYPLGLAGVDLGAWIHDTDLPSAEIREAWRLSCALHAQIQAGRDKVTLMLPKALAGLALWTKQSFEESLGKSEAWGLKIVIDERVRLPNYRPPRNSRQDRVFFAVHYAGSPSPEFNKAAVLKRAGYPVISLTIPRGRGPSAYMQFIHYAVFGLAWLRETNFVTQPGVELYKSIANRIYEEARKAGGIEKSTPWRRFFSAPGRSTWRGRVTVHHGKRDAAPGTPAPQVYAEMLSEQVSTRAVTYGELTFFGDTRYSSAGRALRVRLGHAAERIFRAKLKMPVDVYEGPAMNHSYHEMIIGHGGCFSTVILCESAETLREIDYPSDYHRAQYLATIQALQQRGRAVVGLTIRDLKPETLSALDEFFRQAAKLL
jgi:glucose-6-phosphate isomerase